MKQGKAHPASFPEFLSSRLKSSLLQVAAPENERPRTRVQGRIWHAKLALSDAYFRLAFSASSPSRILPRKVIPSDISAKPSTAYVPGSG